jgi:hypothetical protein
MCMKYNTNSAIEMHQASVSTFPSPEISQIEGNQSLLKLRTFVLYVSALKCTALHSVIERHNQLYRH